jgi:hypothetical protein
MGLRSRSAMDIIRESESLDPGSTPGGIANSRGWANGKVARFKPFPVRVRGRAPWGHSSMAEQPAFNRSTAGPIPRAPSRGRQARSRPPRAHAKTCPLSSFGKKVAASGLNFSSIPCKIFYIFPLRIASLRALTGNANLIITRIAGLPDLCLLRR